MFHNWYWSAAIVTAKAAVKYYKISISLQGYKAWQWIMVWFLIQVPTHCENSPVCLASAHYSSLASHTQPPLRGSLLVSCMVHIASSWKSNFQYLLTVQDIVQLIFDSGCLLWCTKCWSKAACVIEAESVCLSKAMLDLQSDWPHGNRDVAHGNMPSITRPSPPCVILKVICAGVSLRDVI